MKTLTSFFNGKTEKATFNRFEDSTLEMNFMNRVRGGDNDPTTDIWIPDDDNETD